MFKKFKFIKSGRRKPSAYYNELVYSDVVTPKHIDDLMSTDKIVIRYYNKKKRISKIEFTPETLEEYLQHFITRGFDKHGK